MLGTLRQILRLHLAVAQDEYSIQNSKHFIGIHGYMLVYSVASKSSFEIISVIRDKILNHLVRGSCASSLIPH